MTYKLEGKGTLLMFLGFIAGIMVLNSEINGNIWYKGITVFFLFLGAIIDIVIPEKY